jgi:GntR family transcriptional regulator
MTEEPTRPQRIANDLREEIRSGEYRPGHQIPSGRALAYRYGVSRPTVQKAIEILRSEGLIVGQQGAGWFVREKPAVIREGLPRLSRGEREAGRGCSLTDGANAGITMTSETAIRFEPACERVATLLGIEQGEETTVRDRVMYADGHPVQLAVSRLPRSVTRGTAIERRNAGTGGTYARLEESGRMLGRFEERITVRPVTPEEAAALKLPAGSPVLVITRVAYEKSGDPLEVNDMVLAGDRYELVYDLPAD